MHRRGLIRRPPPSHPPKEMPKTQNTPAETPSQRRGRGRWNLFRKLFARERKSDGHWFDHPEMQARIAEADADRREGRVKRFKTREEALAYFDRQT